MVKHFLVLLSLLALQTGCTANSVTVACNSSLAVKLDGINIGIAGAPAIAVKCGKALPVQLASPETLTLRDAIKENNLDYLIVVKTDIKEEQRTDVGATAKQAGLFIASIVVSALSRTATNLNNDTASHEYIVKVVTATATAYRSDGTAMTSESCTREFGYSETIPSDLAAEPIVNCLSKLAS